MKKVLVLLMIMIVTITFSSCVRTDNNIEKYADDVENYYAGLFMPDLEDIGDYKEISYFSRKDESIFSQYSLQLIAKYDEKIFSQSFPRAGHCSGLWGFDSDRLFAFKPSHRNRNGRKSSLH